MRFADINTDTENKMGSGNNGNFISIAEPLRRYYRKIRIEIREKE